MKLKSYKNCKANITKLEKQGYEKCPFSTDLYFVDNEWIPYLYLNTTVDGYYVHSNCKGGNKRGSFHK